MKANEFVKKYGLGVAKEYLNECPEFCNYLHDGGFYKITENYQVTDRHVLVSDLKRLVESHELVENCGGLQSSKANLKLLELSLDIGLFHGTSFNADTDVPRLKQAIADAESCQ